MCKVSGGLGRSWPTASLSSSGKRLDYPPPMPTPQASSPPTSSRTPEVVCLDEGVQSSHVRVTPIAPHVLEEGTRKEEKNPLGAWTDSAAGLLIRDDVDLAKVRQR